MKSCAPLILLSGLLIAGCASHQSDFSAVPGPSGGKTVSITAPQSPPPQTQPPANSQPPAPIITPDNSLAGKVVDYNSVGRFVVLNFPVGKMAKMDQTLFIYRNGLKVGEVKVTGPQSDNNIVADLVNGEAQIGDEVRDQ